MASLLVVVICATLIVDLKATSEGEATGEITQDLKDLLHTSMINIVSLNDLVTELTQRVSKLTLLQTDLHTEIKDLKILFKETDAKLRQGANNTQLRVEELKLSLTETNKKSEERAITTQLAMEELKLSLTETNKESEKRANSTKLAMEELKLSVIETNKESEERANTTKLAMEEFQRDLVEVREGLTRLQPRDGGWTEFGDWSGCSAKCGGGTQTRTRTCNNPAPANRGADCVGQEEDTRECNTDRCELYNVYITCDNYLTLYIDGTEVRPEGLMQWTTLSIFQIPSSTTTIAVKCSDHNGGRRDACGIIGAVQDSQGRDIAVTDSSWRCFDSWESGWQLPNFTERDHWKQAEDQGGSHPMLVSQNGGWKDIPSTNKRVIWGSTGSGTVYCRKTI